MKETLLVKHAVGGRMFIDSNKHTITYKVEPQGEGWRFTIDGAWSEEIEALLSYKEELNVFIFNVYEDQPTLKTWYYVKDGPVVYDSDQARLTIVAESRIEYYPHQYSTE